MEGKALVESRCATERAGESASCVKNSRNDETISYLSRQALIDLLGRDDAARLVAHFGGTRLYIPTVESASYPAIAAAAGNRAAAILATRFGGERIMLPSRVFSLRDRVEELLREGDFPPPEIARRLRCSERQVYYILSKRAAT